MAEDLNQHKNKPKLSVVVIAYNNELYIEEALQSLYEQTFQNMEVVVVNDNSTDRTGDLINQFVKNKPNFKSIHLQKNSGGCSTPRNTGITNSTGEYLMFLDGDDWYTVDACEKMVDAIERTDSDFVAGQAIRTNNYEIWYYSQIYSQERININIRQFKMLLFDSLSVNKIYKREFLDKHKLRFPEGIHYEDVLFTGKAYFLADSVSIIPELIYYWRVVEDSNVKSISNRRYEFENFNNRIISHRYYDEFLRDIGAQHYQEHKNNRFLRHDLKLYTNDYLLFDENYKLRFHKLIYEYLHEVMDEYAFIHLSESDRIMYYLLYVGDREAFEDYLLYINDLPTKSDRIYVDNGKYYFYSSISEDKRLLHIEQPKVNIELKNILLNGNTMLFESTIRMNSVKSLQKTYFWMLENRNTGSMISSEQIDNSDNIFKIDLANVKPGNYYLFLYLIHEGISHRILVEQPDIKDLLNERVQNRNLTISTFINHKNFFALKVRPLTNTGKVKWMLTGNKNIKSKRIGFLRTKVSNYIKKVIRKMPLRSKWILFESHMGKQFSDSPKYIYNQLYKSGEKYKYIWSFENPDAIQIPGPAKKVKRNSLKHYYYLNRSKYWIDNQGMAHLTPKKNNQVYIQTWHGTPLKRMGYDQKRVPGKAELDRLRWHSEKWNYFISNNRYSTEIFRKAFRYGGNIIETGYPRNDILINQPEDIVQMVQGYFNIPKNKEVILFAPTFRDWDLNAFQKTLTDINQLSKNVNENTVILLRLHYLISEKISYIPLPKNVINASDYQDIQELYLIADILITDYSSVMFDYALLKRPIIFYCYDLQEYMTRRGMYFDLTKHAPGPICKTVEEVTAYLKNKDKFRGFDVALNKFTQQFGCLEDGNSSIRVIDQVFNKLQ